MRNRADFYSLISAVQRCHSQLVEHSNIKCYKWNSTLLLFSFSKKSEKASSSTCLTHRIKHDTQDKTQHQDRLPLTDDDRGKFCYLIGRTLFLNQTAPHETFCIKPPAHDVTKLCPEMAALQELTCDEGSLATSSDLTHLLLTSHHQNFSHSLTNLTDSCFVFFSMSQGYKITRWQKTGPPRQNNYTPKSSTTKTC